MANPKATGTFIAECRKEKGLAAEGYFQEKAEMPDRSISWRPVIISGCGNWKTFSELELVRIIGVGKN